MISMNKVYIIRKYVEAKNALEAIRKEKRLPVDDVFVDDDWKKAQETSKQIGLNK